jgi:dihydrofolate synthase/folylpolyglutamate synthase
VKQPDPDAAYDFLLSLPRFALTGSAAYRPGLERISALLSEAGDPHLRVPTIHVAGTNGKGSVASMIAAVLTASGLRVGLHTSPHFMGLEERMRIGPEPAPRAWVSATTERLQDLIHQVGASFFEATVLLSFLYFDQQDVDAAVVEVGLGGRYDATNVVRPDVTVITEISLEHTDILGDTLSAIAAEKAGVIKAGAPAVTTAQGEALATISTRGADAGVAVEDVRKTCQVVDPEIRLTGTRLGVRTPAGHYEDLALELAGRHQLWNAVLAIRSAELFRSGRGKILPPEAVALGAARVRVYAGLRGRLEILATEPTIIVDNAHNAHGLEALLSHVGQFQRGRLHVAIGLMKDKNAESVSDLLARAGASVSVLELAGERAMDSHELEALLKHRGVRVDICSSVSQAVDEFLRHAEAHDVLLLTGSHLVVFDALSCRTNS